MSERDEIIRNMCRLLAIKPKHLAELGIAMDDYVAIEKFLKVPGWFANPAQLDEARRGLADYSAFLEEAGRRMKERFSA